MLDICTYFDHRYAPFGLALYETLLQQGRPFRLFVLCLDELCEQILRQLNRPEIVVVPLDALERADPELAAAKTNRSRIEYYFTCTAAWCSYVLQHHADVDVIHYADSDLGFFGDPQAIVDELGDHSVLIIEHRFPKQLTHLEKYGR